MKPFAGLLERLLYTPQRNVKLALMLDYFRSTPDPDRGWGLAALTDGLVFAHAKPNLIRDLVLARVDPVLFAWSYDFVGDLAETAALLWPAPADGPAAGDWPHLGAVVAGLATTAKAELPALVAGWLDRLDADGRWALLKLVTGSLRVGASARLAKLALAAYGGREPAEIEEVWHREEPPYTALFAWLDGRGERPAVAGLPVFRPLMLAHPLEAPDLPRLAEGLDAFAVEWKWDGIRVQVVAPPATAAPAGGRGGVRLYSRTGDDITGAFPEIAEAADGLDVVLDGELLVGRAADPARPDDAGALQSFNDLQQRLGRKEPTAAMLARYPAFVRLYDLLFAGEEDLRPLPWTERRARLEAWLRLGRPAKMDLSPLLPASDLATLDALRLDAAGGLIEGLMLKRRDAPYVAGRPKGLWWKWKREARLIDAVVMYAQRGHGKRSSFYSDYTFGAWRDGEDGAELVPVGKAYSGFTDVELKLLDKWVRDHTVNRFGPVREVARGLVLEIAFDAVQRSTRHKSGLALRFPRVNRIRWDKPAAEADRLETLERMLE